MIDQTMKRVFIRWCCGFLLAIVSLSALAESFRVSDIRVEGLQRVSAGTVFTALPIRVGDTVTQADIQEATRELFKQGFFTDVAINRDGDVLVMVFKERPAISKQIADARDKGDLSENAEYDAAKDEQGHLELKISKLETIIRNSKVVDGSKIDTSKVAILSKVKIKNSANGKMMTYWIVPETEANLKEGKISVDSPIARGLLGKKVKDKADVRVPAGKITFEIIEIGK